MHKYGCMYVRMYVCACIAVSVIMNGSGQWCTYVCNIIIIKILHTNICAAEMKTKESELKKTIHLKEIMHKSIMQQKVPHYTYVPTYTKWLYICVCTELLDLPALFHCC